MAPGRDAATEVGAGGRSSGARGTATCSWRGPPPPRGRVAPELAYGGLQRPGAAREEGWRRARLRRSGWGEGLGGGGGGGVERVARLDYAGWGKGEEGYV